ncbi:MAG TPA: hypothetical protein VEY67_11740 [Candidatus Dormibacteraeota bacterium]|nr:hypothetical protein [Candidatus Dormibacteraeota bacterium]
MTESEDPRERVEAPAAERPAEPSAHPEPEPPEPTPEPPPLPTARELISVGLELAYRSRRSIRNASLAIGLQLLAAVGPLVLLLIVVATKAPTALEGFANGVPPEPGSPEEPILASFAVTFIVAILAFGLLAVESRIIAAGILGGEAAGRPIVPHEGLRRSRQVFWRVVAATVVVQVPLAFVANLAEGLVSPILGGSQEALVLVGLVVSTLLTVPFAYVLTGIVLGGAPPVEAIRRSIRLARVRWRLAVVAAIAEALTQTLLILGLGAGLDVIATLATGLGLGIESGPLGTFATLALALLGTAAVGSLWFTVAAIAAAPQVVAFVGLTRYTAGMDAARDGSATRGVRWVSIPMAIGIVLGLLASIGGVSAAMRAV